MFRYKQGWYIVALAVVLALLPTGAAQAQIGPGPFAYFPTGDVTDARFLGFGCTGIATFEQAVNIGIAAPVNQVDFSLNVFDGDTGKPDTGGKLHWDSGTRQLVYRLYADPFRQGSTDPGNLIGEWFGNDPNPLSSPNWTASAATMPDNDWWGVTIANQPQAQAPSGHYFYNLSMTTVGACNPGEQLVSNLKVATSNPLTFLLPRFAFEAGLRQTTNDSAIVYPGLVLPTSGRGFLDSPTTFDGTFDFFLELPPGETDLQLFDGDFDFGTGANLITAPSGVLLTPCFDLDDPDTPPTYSNLPFPAAGATPEGVQGPGSPADDSRLDAFRRGEPGQPDRLGCIRYEVIDPLGNVYRNDNPSGSFEWEQFRIATNLAADSGNSDHVVGGDYLPAGIWTVHSIGLDMANLNFWAADACATRLLPGGGLEAACPRISSLLLGDTVFLDTDLDGILDPGKAGIPGVVLNLRREPGGPLLDTVITGDTSNPNWTACLLQNTGNDTAGLYCFGVDDADTYYVEIAPANFAPGGALADLSSTTGGEQQTFEVDDENVLTFDFGYAAAPVSVGDRVWRDLNGDGDQDGGEPGINGVTVELLDGGGNLLATTVTAGNGLYFFGDLPAGSYSVRVVSSTLPAGLSPTYDLDGTGTPHQAAVTLDTDRDDVDFGYAQIGTLGDRIWRDNDGDGVQEAGENGINGVTVQLVFDGNVIATTVTAGDGGYLFQIFGNLAAQYTVRVVPSTLPAGLTQTYDLDGLGTPHEATVITSSAQNRLDVDFGYRRQPGDAECALRANGDPVYNQDPAGFAFWLPNIARDLVFEPSPGVFDENPDGTAHLTGTVRRASPANGFFVDVTFTGYTTVPGPGSPKKDLRPIAYIENGGPIDPATWWYYPTFTGTLTGFGSAFGGSVIHIVNTGPAFQVGEGASGKNLNFGAGGWFNWTVVTQPTSGAPLQVTGVGDVNVDLSVCPPLGSIGDRLWYDTDGDGVQDVGEAGLNGVTVQLLDNRGDLIGTTVTAGNGGYLFQNLVAGTYTVRVVSATLPAGLNATYDLDGLATLHTARLTLAAGANRTDADFGYRGTASLGDRLWNDLDGDGVQEAGEPGITGVTVELRDGGGNLIATTTTAGDGIYGFANLNAGSYSVRVVASTLPAGFVQTYDLDGIGSAHTAAATLAAGQARTDVDFGYQATGSIGDRVWTDTDGDGVQDAGEAGINGVTVELLDNGGNVITTTTTAGDGAYTFDDLAAGSYSVRVVPSSLPAGSAPTYDLDGIGSAHIAAVLLGSGEDRTDVDFGYRGTASLGDRVWNDADGDGIQDAGENGLTGVTVQLLSGSTVIATTTTGANGIYTFGNLAAGTYTVRVVASTLPAGVAPTFDLDGIATAHTATATLTGGQNRTDVDFGYRTPPVSCVAGYFKDHFNTASFSNNDGTLSWAGAWIESDVAGAGVSSGNVTVGSPYAGYLFLRDSPDTGTQPSAARQLNLSGFTSATLSFAFHVRTAVDPDDAVVVEISKDGGATYTVLETLAGFTGTAEGTRSYNISAYIASNTRIRFRVSSNYGASDELFKLDWIKVDAGCGNDGSIGDRLWYDIDGDGNQDAGEFGLPGVSVELLNSGGTVIATRTTDSNGVYSFDGLAAGNYTVRVVSSTFPVGGLAPTYDLDGTGTAHTAAVTLAAGQDRTDVDFGYRGTRSLGDRVWNDADGDGSQDASETGINGVTVRLFLGTTEVGSTVTAGNGNYTFSNLPETTYIVRVDAATLPAGMTQTYDLDGTSSAHQATVALTVSRTDVDFGYRTPPVACTPGYVKDHFNNASFSNNDGTFNWSGSWIESDTAGAGVNSGNVTVGNPYAGYLFLRDSPDTGTQPSAARQVNLSGFTSATLSFSFHVRTGIDPDDAVVIEISKDGGATYTVLETLDGYTGSDEDSRTFNISAYIASNTRIRFRVSNNYGASDELFKLDWVKIEGTCTPGSQTGSIGNRVWKDTDNDGVQDASETGINGATVQLLNGSGTVIATATTAGNGDYTFNGLAAGSYSVRVVSSTLPTGVTPTYDLDGTGSAHIAAVSLTSGQTRTDVDFGYRTAQVSCTAGYFKDHFNNASFSNNDGTLNWAGAWIESDSAGAGVSSGNVTVGTPYEGYLFLSDSPDTGTQPSAARQVNLSGFTSATLSFSFHVRTGIDPEDAVVIEISKNGGSTYTVLETLDGYTGSDEDSRTFNISSYIASNTRIRFRVSNGYGASDELFKLDWVKISGSCD